MTVPGMPDFFQGTEFWDFSLVDPDNRRPIDYAVREAALAEGDVAERLLETWRDGRVKQAVIRSVLGLRREAAALFARGRYQPLAVAGPLAERIIAFARVDASSSVLVVVPRLALGVLRGSGRLLLDPAGLARSAVLIPTELRGRPMRALFGGGEVVTLGPDLMLDTVLSGFPLAVLHAV
jgi:(1->4)-alpha-D-glucan 1-alpha-D-glucosylmutase